MVSKASEDLPEPDRPVNTTSLSRGMVTSIFLRLCSRAPRMEIARASPPFLPGLSLITGWNVVRTAAFRQPLGGGAGSRGDNAGADAGRPLFRFLIKITRCRFAGATAKKEPGIELERGPGMRGVRGA